MYSTTMIPALLFDLDGTIVETDHLHFQAFNRTFAPHGVSVDWDTYKARIIGRANPLIAADFLPHVDVAQRDAIMNGKEAAYRDLITTMEPAPGLVALLDWAHGAGVRCGVVTNAPRANADRVLAELRLAARFDVVVIGPELQDAKPHPLPYLRALEILKGDPARSVAFEDSPSGATSAVAAGLAVVGLLTSVEAALLTGVGVEIVARDFTSPEVLAFIKRRTGMTS